MVRISSPLKIIYIFIFILTLLIVPGAYAEYTVSVLLSFDIEIEEDAIALRSLNISEPATYFVTGEFAEKYPQVVAALAKINGSINKTKGF